MKKYLPTLAIITPFLAVATFATLSNAATQGMNEGDMLGKSEIEVITALEALGATIENVETETDELEVELTLDGIAYEIEVDLTTGIVAEIETDDEDDKEEDG